MNRKEFSIQRMLDSSFLSTFTRPNIDYHNNKDATLLEAYRSGIYDATVNFIGESNLKVTGTSETIEEVKKFLRQTSFNGELHLKDSNDDSIKTVSGQELLVDNWFKRNSNKSRYTQLVLMIPKDNDRNKLSKIVHDFFQQKFNNSNYVYVEHTDTDIFHYHVIVENIFNDDLLLKLRSDFIVLCIEHGAKLL